MIAIPEGMRLCVDLEQERFGQRLTMVAMVDGTVVGVYRAFVGVGVKHDRCESEQDGLEYLVNLYVWKQGKQGAETQA